METEDSLSCSQDSATCPYPEPDESNHTSLCFLKINSNIILPSTSRSSSV